MANLLDRQDTLEPNAGIPLMSFGLVASAFDLLHPGHMLMLKEAKSLCVHLIAGLHIDPSVGPVEYRGKKKNVPVYSLEDRFEMLSGIRWVDETFVYKDEPDLLACIKQIAARGDHVRVLGSDWVGKEATGQHLAARVHYHVRNHNWSSTAMRNFFVRTLA